MKHIPILTSVGILGRLLILLGIMCLGIITTTLLVSIISLITDSESINGSFSANWMKGLQLIQAIALFIIPAIILAQLITTNPWKYLGLNQRPNIKSIALITISMFVLVPSMNLIIEWNEAIRFPEWLAPLEAWMREKEDIATETTKMLLTTQSLSGWLFNLFLVGIVAAVSEELFFRGILQNLFQDKWHSKCFAILLSALIFSAIHLQFYGFTPRFLLGAYFGYLFLISNNLWLPIWAHFINNAMALLQFYMEGKNTELPFNEALTPTMNYLLGAISFFAFIWIALTLKKWSKLS